MQEKYPKKFPPASNYQKEAEKENIHNLDAVAGARKIFSKKKSHLCEKFTVKKSHPARELFSKKNRTSCEKVSVSEKNCTPRETFSEKMCLGEGISKI